MAGIELHPDFREFLKYLNSQEVEYMLIGGYAVGYHGYPRATGDMDVWIAVDQKNANKVVMALHEFGMSRTELTKELFLESNRVVRMGVPPVRINNNRNFWRGISRLLLAPRIDRNRQCAYKCHFS